MLFGYSKSKATGQPPFMGAVRTTLIGVIAAAAAYFIAASIGG
jgi:VIT1/CCC1 family predicted Fe2+/Mn2+ transporter